jgi:hypothetical protein
VNHVFLCALINDPTMREHSESFPSTERENNLLACEGLLHETITEGKVCKVDWRPPFAIHSE